MKIYLPFFITKPSEQGTGLGFSLAYDIVKAHFSIIAVNTNGDSSTIFTIELPFN